MTVSEAGRKGGEVRGRRNVGTRNPNAKLSPSSIPDIRGAKGVFSAIRLGERHSCHPEHIRAIWRGRYWKDD